MVKVLQSPPPPPNTADLGTDKKQRYWGGGGGIGRGGIGWGVTVETIVNAAFRLYGVALSWNMGG